MFKWSCKKETVNMFRWGGTKRKRTCKYSARLVCLAFGTDVEFLIKKKIHCLYVSCVAIPSALVLRFPPRFTAHNWTFLESWSWVWTSVSSVSMKWVIPGHEVLERAFYSAELFNSPCSNVWVACVLLQIKHWSGVSTAGEVIWNDHTGEYNWETTDFSKIWSALPLPVKLMTEGACFLNFLWFYKT